MLHSDAFVWDVQCSREFPLPHYSCNSLSLSLSPRFNGHFSGELGLAGIYWSKRMMDVVVTTGAISRAKLQSNHHHQQSVFFTGRMPFLHPTNSVKAHYSCNTSQNCSTDLFKYSRYSKLEIIRFCHRKVMFSWPGSFSFTSGQQIHSIQFKLVTFIHSTLVRK